MISPIQFIFGWFGYVKVSKAVVQLSMAQEDIFKMFAAIDKRFEPHLEGQRKITEFLRAGRSLIRVR